MSKRRSSVVDALKLQSNRNLMESFLLSAAELSERDNDIEKPSEKTRCVDIDGRKVVFSLVKNLTQRPKTSREARQKIDLTNKNVKLRGPCRERVVRRFLMKFDIPQLTILYLVTFVAMNAVFAALWTIETDGCCEDATMTFWQHFDFAVQTSSTIGYGGYWPRGYLNNALVVLLTTLSILLSTVYAGLLFFKFILPEANIEFSEVITLSNVMGQPCLEIRVGNTDGNNNKLINAEASLTVVSRQEYRDPDDDKMRQISQPEDLKLAVTSQHLLLGVWTLRHFIDETSPLYGFRFDEFPGNTIMSFQLNIKAIQTLTKGEVYAQTMYQVTDVLVGHSFQDQAIWNPGDVRKGIFDYAKMSSTRPSLVWYPQKKDDMECDEEIVST